MPKGTPLTPAEIQRRRAEIMRAAMQLFIQKGFNETAMHEIARAAGVGKSTLYDYFPAKDEILISYILEEVDQMQAAALQISAQPLSAAEKFRRIMARQMEYMLENRAMYLRLTFEAQRLSLEQQQRIQAHRHAYQDMLCALVEEGVRAGEFRPVSPLMAIRAMFSLLTAAAFTTRPTGTPQEMMAEAFDIIFRGLERREENPQKKKEGQEESADDADDADARR